MKHGEWMTEYLDELICLFRKARHGAFVQFQDEEVKNSTISTREPMRNAPNSVHSLSSKGINYITKQLLVASNAQPIQTVVKLPVPITCGETHGNQTQQCGSGIWSEKR